MDLEEIDEDIQVEDPMDMEAEDDEFEITQGGSCHEEDKFDYIVGQIQDLVMSEEFTGLQDSFFSDNCCQFEASEENKLEYMTIFSQYVETIERYIESSLQDVNF